MRKKLMSVCIVAILVYGMYDYAQTVGDSLTKDTGRLYAKDSGTLTPLGADVLKGMQLPDVARNSAWNREPELVYDEDGTRLQTACDEEGQKVLNQMLDFIKKEKVIEQKEVSGDWGVIYYGECTYFNRRYHEVHLVEEHDTHVVTLKRYYIDALSGNICEEPYESFIGMYSDVALHFVGRIEVGEEEIAEIGTVRDGILYEHTPAGKTW